MTCLDGIATKRHFQLAEVRDKVGGGLAFLGIFCVTPQQAGVVDKWPCRTIRLEMIFECKHRHLVWSMGVLVTVHCVVHLLAAGVQRCI